jgi:PAS domain S-box-containing protein
MEADHINILVVEDNPGDVILVTKILSTDQRYKIKTANSLADGLRRLQGRGVDLILLDLSLPDSQGLDTFHRINDQAQGIPVVVLSGTEDENLASEAVHVGAQDYLTKGQIEPSLILRSVRYAIERGRLERERMQFLRKERVAREEAEAAQQRFAFLAEVSAELVTSLDYQQTLEMVAHLAVRWFADYCIVYTVDESGEFLPSQIVHRDPEKQQGLIARTNAYLPDTKNPNSFLAHVQQTRQSLLLHNLPEDLLQRLARDAKHLEVLRSLAKTSAILTPLLARNRMLGIIVFALSGTDQCYEQADVPLAEELARRAALALDNARLYSQAQTINMELEKRVSERTDQLMKMVEKLRNEIHERKRVEETLNETQVLFSSLFESAPDAILLVDRQGVIGHVNAQAEILFGYTRQELVGSSVDQLLPQHLQKTHASLREAYLSEMTTRPMGLGLELFAQSKNKHEIPVDIMLSPVETPNGSYVITAVRDITERKRLQEELAEIHRRLFENIEAERLRLSQELHDGPMQELYAVMFQLSALRKNIGESEASSLEEVEKMVQDVLDSLRALSIGLRPPALMSFGLAKVIHTHLQSITDAKPDLQVKKELMDDAQILPERVRLALFRVYQNAVSNVIRHSDASRLEVRFWFDSEQVYLEIRDNGKGFTLPPKWVQLARGGHFGLVGIADRVEAIGGRLEINTQPGGGTHLTVYVPLSNGKGNELVEKDLTGGC